MGELEEDVEEPADLCEVLECERFDLREVEGALERLKAEVYGRCEDCEASIHPQRLAALPFTRICIACQRAAELEEGDSLL